MLDVGSWMLEERQSTDGNSNWHTADGTRQTTEGRDERQRAGGTTPAATG